jgi:hypothetical protein
MMRFMARAAFRPARGEHVCGDAWRAIEHDGRLLVAVADGLGHGALAREAALEFCALAEARASEPLEALLSSAGGALCSNRGAAVALLELDFKRGTVSFCGLGNVSVLAFGGSKLSAVSMPGILGRRVTRLRTFAAALAPTHSFLMFTDGIRASGEEFEPIDHGDLGAALERVIETRGRSYDDALCVGIRHELAV